MTHPFADLNKKFDKPAEPEDADRIEFAALHHGWRIKWAKDAEQYENDFEMFVRAHREQIDKSMRIVAEKEAKKLRAKDYLDCGCRHDEGCICYTRD